MLKRLLATLAIAAALVACTPATDNGGGATAEPSVAAPSDALPSESVGTESASPSAS